MTVSAVQSNATPSALVLNTETTLESPAITAAGVYVLVVETQNLGLGDMLIARIKTKGVTGTLQTVLSYAYANPQSELNKVSVPIPNDGTQVSFTLEQTAGTGRVIPWKILSL